MSNPIIKVAKPRTSIIGLEAKDFALNTNYLLPKIYKQIICTEETTLYNRLGYAHGSWAFRRLNEDSYYEKNPTTSSIWDPDSYYGGDIYNHLFTGNEYCFFNVSSMGMIEQGVKVSNDNIVISPSKYISDWIGENPVYKSDPSMTTVLFTESLIQTSNKVLLPSRPRISVGVEGEDLHQTNLSERKMDSRLDTLKIFKTGLLTLELPEETLVYHADSVAHIASFTHGLGYPPMYFPPYTINMRGVGGLIPGFTNNGESTDVYVDNEKLYLRVIRTSYGDNAFEEAGGDRVYSAETISIYYTIFYNDISEEFDLLS